jgi:hypothetical protein
MPAQPPPEPAPTVDAARGANPTPSLAPIADPSTVASTTVPVNDAKATVEASVGADTASMRKYAAAVGDLRVLADSAKSHLLEMSVRAGNFPSALALAKAVAPTADGSSASLADTAYKGIQTIQTAFQNTSQGILKTADLLDNAEHNAVKKVK